MLPNCNKCNRELESIDGICNKAKAKDSLIFRCVGGWSNDKFYYLRRYIDAFGTAMRKKWKINYIDLFSGPGICFDRENQKEIEGSPLIALNCKYPFNNYYFVDSNKKVISTLKQRVKKYSYNIYCKLNDCNKEIDNIIKKSITSDSLNLAFVDPDGLDIYFPTIEKLAEGRVDLIINLSLGMAIKRNIERASRANQSKLDLFFGEKEWRKEYKKTISKKGTGAIGYFIIKYYHRKLEKLGYEILVPSYEIKSSQTKTPLYHLFFASKHKLGNELWKRIGKITPSGQRSFF